MSWKRVLLSLFGVALLADVSHAAAFAIVTDPEGSCRQVQIGPGETRRVYLVYGFGFFEEMASTRIRLFGFPPGWSLAVQPGPYATLLSGSLLGTGTTIWVQTGFGSPVLLATLDITAGSGSAVLWAVPPNQTEPPSFDATFVTVTTTGGGTLEAWTWPFEVNRGTPCATPVAAQTWSAVKRLYSD